MHRSAAENTALAEDARVVNSKARERHAVVTAVSVPFKHGDRRLRLQGVFADRVSKSRSDGHVADHRLHSQGTGSAVYSNNEVL